MSFPFELLSHAGSSQPAAGVSAGRGPESAEHPGRPDVSAPPRDAAGAPGVVPSRAGHPHGVGRAAGASTLRLREHVQQQPLGGMETDSSAMPLRSLPLLPQLAEPLACVPRARGLREVRLCIPSGGSFQKPGALTETVNSRALKGTPPMYTNCQVSLPIIDEEYLSKPILGEL